MSTATVEAKQLPDRLMPRVEVARLFGVTEQTIRIWEHDGQIPRSIKVGRKSYWHPGAIAKVLGVEES